MVLSAGSLACWLPSDGDLAVRPEISAWLRCPQGYIDNRHRGFGYNNLDKLKYEVEGLMAKYEVEPNAR